MNIYLPAILMFTRGTRFWHTANYVTITIQFLVGPLVLFDPSLAPNFWRRLSQVCCRNGANGAARPKSPQSCMDTPGPLGHGSTGLGIWGAGRSENGEYPTKNGLWMGNMIVNQWIWNSPFSDTPKNDPLKKTHPHDRNMKSRKPKGPFRRTNDRTESFNCFNITEWTC